ncbi:flavin monoamine oxidase family protein [Polyangium aurulentum]|uniref:flavin monoamine oxidase family protein n=1 Tax=Polyangium aurulentum TaxID=2567896 RepID=UPI00197D2922|nr:FAD-dependent oxidoreductase [Polyangium aurulentum]UQA55807.1 FAD-dependent oxidoreductase [Polyangium aurulentum]
MERFAAAESRKASRRSFLKGIGGLAAAGAVIGGSRSALAGPSKPNISTSPSIAIVGGGLAGLVCADTLKGSGINATVYEASDRAGGRCFSLGGSFAGPVSFPGQVVERGGEFIDNLHKTMIGYAQEFGLALEDVEKLPGEIFYHFYGQRWPESAIVDEYRDLVAAMQDDLQTSSGAPTADYATPGDVDLDYTSLREYLDTRGAGPLVSAAIEAAYLAEYGLEIDEQSSLNFLLFIHADRRSKFTPFGVYSDERYHVVNGNQKIVEGLKGKLPGQVQYGMRLLAARKTAAGRVELTFQKTGSGTVTTAFDAVVFAVPFSTLRNVQLDASLGLPTWKVQAIKELGYGSNAKTMVGFKGPFWRNLGSNGTSYSLMPNHQTTWESNPINATATSAVLTDYSSGMRADALDPTKVQAQVAALLGDLNLVYPGALAAAAKDGKGKYLAHLEHWPSNPNTLGAYTCYLPGQFTTLANNEGKPVGNIHFAGEHANSFYEWQGFMEGACLSGIQAANEILQDIKVGNL